MALVFTMYMLFGSIFSVGKLAVTASQPYFFTSMRMALAGLLFTGYLFLKNGRNWQALKLSKEHWPMLFAVALFNVFITNALEFWGLQYMGAGKTCLLYSLSPFASAFIGYCFNTENLCKAQWSGLFIGMLSFLPLTLAPWLQEENTNNYHEILAELALATSAITSVIGWNCLRNLTIEKKVPHTIVNGYSFILAAIMSLLVSFCVEPWGQIPISSWSTFIWTLIYVVIIHNVICYTIYASALQKFSVTFMAFAGLSNPIFAALFGALFLQESIDLTFVFAFLGISLGLYLFYSKESRPEDSLTEYAKI